MSSWLIPSKCLGDHRDKFLLLVRHGYSAELYGELDGKQEINEELREANKMLKSQLEQVAGELSECGVGASAVNSLVSQLGAPRAADAGSNDYWMAKYWSVCTGQHTWIKFA